MNSKAGPNEADGEICDLGNDFTLLTKGQKREVLKIARTYRKLLEDSDVADMANDASPDERQQNPL